jgi:hypothetical protein
VARVDTKPWEETQSRSKRDRLRADVLARTPRWYSEWMHLAFPSTFGIVAIVAALAGLDAPSWREWAAVPASLVFLNLDEWWIHRNILHRRFWPLEALFWRHTPEHHQIFVRDDMAMRSTKEFRLVLIPSYGIVAIFLTTLPVTMALWSFVSPNVARFWVACSMGYVVSYEWLHLAYHLPVENPIAKARLIGWLRQQHAVHHTPELMQRWNFNVTIPFGDWLLGTTYRDSLPG